MKYHDHEHRVLYGETDKMGVSYYANYFVWFEAARNEYFRTLGRPYTECEKAGYYLPVVETQARYLAPSTYDDLIVIRTSVSRLRASSIRFDYRIFNRETGRELVTGYSLHVFVSSAMRPARPPKEFIEGIEVHPLLETV